MVRVILRHRPVRAELELRGEPTVRIDLDFRARLARIVVDGPRHGADSRVTCEAGVMHAILSGRLAPGIAVGQRRLLLRGNSSDFATLIPLLELAPALYREHRADRGEGALCRGSARPLSPEEAMTPTSEMSPADREQLYALAWQDAGPFTRAVVAVARAAAWLIGWSLAVLRYRLLPLFSLFDVLTALEAGPGSRRRRTSPPSSTTW